MAIQIRELIIRASVDKKNIIGHPAQTPQPLSRRDVYALKKQILDECMDKVEKLLDRRNRR